MLNFVPFGSEPNPPKLNLAKKIQKLILVMCASLWPMTLSLYCYIQPQSTLPDVTEAAKVKLSKFRGTYMYYAIKFAPMKISRYTVLEHTSRNIKKIGFAKLVFENSPP